MQSLGAKALPHDFETIFHCLRQMRQAAQSSAWETMIEWGERYNAAIAVLREHMDRDLPSLGQRQIYATQLQDILNLEAETVALVKAQMQTMEGQLGRLHQTRRLHHSYGRLQADSARR